MQELEHSYICGTVCIGCLKPREVNMEYLAKQINNTRIVSCIITYGELPKGKEQDFFPSQKDIHKAKRRFNALRMPGASVLADVLVYLYQTDRIVLDRFQFAFDENRLDRLQEEPCFPYEDDEISELPSMDMGDSEGLYTALHELVAASKAYAHPKHRGTYDAALLSEMFSDAALLLIRKTSQGSA